MSFLSSLQFHHLGVATRHPERTLDFLRLLGYEIGPMVRDDLQRVDLVLCESPAMPRIEVISKTGEAGPLDKILANTEVQMYHTCYEVADLDEVLAAWKREGLRPYCVSAPKPAILFDNRLVSFYYMSSFGLIELLER